MSKEWTTKKLIGAGEIARRVRELGAEINTHYGGEEVTVVMLLNGALYFTADLTRELTGKVKVEGLKVSSYHGGTNSTGKVDIDERSDLDLAGRHVLVVDDILDTGQTLATVTRALGQHSPRSLQTCVLLDKAVPRAEEFEADFVGFTIANQFVVGYGLDYQGYERNLPSIEVLEFVSPT